MDFHFITYSAAGNIVGVAYYPRLFAVQQFVSDSKLRKHLKALAVQNDCDSVMVLVKTTGSNPLLTTIVFEPNSSDEYGTFSAMCGNGVRGVAAYAHEFLRFTDWPLLVGTQSGLLEIEKLSVRAYRVLMGNIVTDKTALLTYVNPAYFPESPKLTDVSIPPRLLCELSLLRFGSGGALCSIGFSTTDINTDKMDGEPHMVIELDGLFARTIQELKKIAQTYGPIICTDRKIFPREINVNFMVPHPDEPASFLICTFERNLGDNPQKSVTQACGTGCTFAGTEFMRKSGLRKVTAQCLGGKLVVERSNDVLYMSGDVTRL